MSEDTKINKNTNARRAILKSMAAGGGAIAAGKMVPEKWAEPVVQSVVLPAHAETSGLATLSGLYGGPVAFAGLNNPAASGIQLAEQKNSDNGLIDVLIPSSYAEHSYHACMTDQPQSIAINVNPDTGTVDICVQLEYDDSGDIVMSATSTLTATGIADVTEISMVQAPASDDAFYLPEGDDDADHWDVVDLTNMVAGPGNTITGTIRSYTTNTDQPGESGDCTTTFTAEFTGGSFSCTPADPQDDD